jgi:hypothetical protein
MVRGSAWSAAREVTTKRGFSPLARCSALTMTRRPQLQLTRVWSSYALKTGVLGQRLALVARAGSGLPGGILFADQYRQQRGQAQAIMVVVALGPEGQPKHPLSHQVADAVLNAVRVAVIGKLRGEPLDNVRPGSHLAQQQPTAVRAEHTPIEFAHQRSLAQVVKFQLLAVTLVIERPSSFLAITACSHDRYARGGGPFFQPLGEIFGLTGYPMFRKRCGPADGAGPRRWLPPYSSFCNGGKTTQTPLPTTSWPPSSDTDFLIFPLYRAFMKKVRIALYCVPSRSTCSNHFCSLFGHGLPL